MDEPKLCPCNYCGNVPEIIWRAGYNHFTPAWILKCGCGLTMNEIVVLPTYEAQQKAKRKLARRWNCANRRADNG